MNTYELQIKEQISDIEAKQKMVLYLVKYIRTHLDYVRTEEELNSHNVVPASSTAGFFSKIGSSLMNKYESGKITKYQSQLFTAKRRLDSFGAGDFNEKYEVFNTIVNELYKNKEDDFSKLLLSIQIVTENDDYFYKTESLAVISSMLWNNQNFLSNLKDKFKRVYSEIANVGLSSTQKLLVIGGGAILLAATGLLAAPAIAALGGAGVAGGAAFTAGLATLGGSLGMTGGLSLLVVIGGVSLGVGSVLTYRGLTTYNKQKIKNDFKKLNYDEVTQLLTIKYLQLEHASLIMPKEEFNNYISDMLAMTSDFKSESLLSALVENQEVDKNSKLTDAYHRFDKIILKRFSNIK